MCAMKRSFDDQTQERIWIETQAVIRLLEAASAGDCTLCNSAALIFENEQNPVMDRKRKIAELLDALGPAARADDRLFERAEQIRAQGLGDMDALHLAFAEKLTASYFVTCDDEILKKAKNANLRVPVIDVVGFVRQLKL